MPRFYFHLHERATVCLDGEGRDLPDLAAARVHAIRDARDVMCGDVIAGRLALDSSIDIADEAGAILLAVPFSEAVQIEA